MANTAVPYDDDSTQSRRSSVLGRRASMDMRIQFGQTTPRKEAESNVGISPRFYQPPLQDEDEAHYGIRPIEHGYLKLDAASAQQDVFRSVFYTDPKYIVPFPPHSLRLPIFSLLL